MKLSNANIAGADQFLHEIQGWERALDYYLQENAFLKMRLSQVLDYNTDNNFTPLAEHFQTSFIHLDECMKDLKKDILLSQKVLKEKGGAVSPGEETLTSRHEKLQIEMNRLEKNFASIKNEFNIRLGKLFTS